MANQTRNSIIDSLLSQGKNTEEIVAEVAKSFPDAPEANVRRQIYSRRNSLKSKTAASSAQ